MKCAMLLGDKGRVLISLSNVIGPVGGYTISFVIHDQYDTRGRPIFPAAGQITILPVLNYTAWWQRHVCEPKLPSDNLKCNNLNPLTGTFVLTVN